MNDKKGDVVLKSPLFTLAVLMGKKNTEYRQNTALKDRDRFSWLQTT